MDNINLDGKTFALLTNSVNGEVSGDTLFYYQQKDDLVTARYEGGSIRYGKIIARQYENNDLKMLYQCLTDSGELKAGSAVAKVSVNSDNKIQLDLKWFWLNGDRTNGTSVYVEILL